MKIIQIMATDGGNIGGLEKHTLQLCQGLAQTQDVHLFLDIHYKDHLPKIDNLNYYYFDFSKGRMNLGILYNIFKKIKEIQPQIIHSQGGKASKIVSFLIPFLNVPTVATIHGMKNNIRSYRYFKEVIAVSSKIAEKIEPYRSVQVIYNGVNLPDNLINQEHQRKKTPQTALAIGRLDPVKGFNLLIEAWQDIPLDLEIIGDGNEYERLNQLILSLNLQHKVKLLGYKKDIYPYLEKSDLVIISSLKEGGPIIVAEALLMHKPLVATDVGMVKDFVPNQYITKGHSINELHQLINIAINRFSQIDKDFSWSFDKARKDLTLDRMITKTIEVYKNIVN